MKFSIQLLMLSWFITGALVAQTPVLTNNGAKIVVKSAAYVVLDGETSNAGLTIKAHEGTQGTIDLDGTIKVDGHLKDASGEGNFFVNTDGFGSLVFTGIDQFCQLQDNLYEFESVEVPFDCNATFTDDAQITIKGDYMVEGDVKFETNDTLPSSVIVEGMTGGTGQSSFELGLESNRWWYVASPVFGGNSGAFNAENDYLYYWNETNTAEHGWNQINNNSINLDEGSGYAFYKTGSDTIVSVSGSIQNGAVSVPLTRTEGVVQEGYNLVGNPYSSAIDWQSDAISKTNIENNTIWFRSNGTFPTFNGNSGFGTLGANSIISPMQSFWVKVANGQTTGEIQFGSSSRTHENFFLMKSNTSSTPALRLCLESSGGKDESVICFPKNAEYSFDKFDSRKQFVDNSATTQVYTLIGENQLAINGMSMQDNLVIPVGLMASENGLHKLKIISSNLPDDYVYYFVDKVENSSKKITDDFMYTFLSPAGTDHGRFEIRIRKSSTEIENFAKGDVEISYRNQEIVVESGYALTGFSEVVGMNGQILKIHKHNGEKQATFRFDGKSGIYLVRYRGKRDVVSRKLFIDN